MASEREITDKFWKHLKSDRTIILGLDGFDGGDAQPMTAVLDDDDSTNRVWIFSAKDVDLVENVGSGHEAFAHFASKGHDVFAALHGMLIPDNDRAMIEKLWNPFIAAWYEGGKDDPKLQLLRFDLDHAHIWLNENSVFAGIKMMLGSDPKKDYKNKTADVRM